ncbi:hypothetical protein EKO27_g9792 [Xylaria grammica]|uniref:Uncharacterized protein n=1 Tax=Xylaria grammica TaxID=363999 RepID=A0A439CT24_9PEZI|nr:hypothetical protein EKO27_g9792 [Xylaria grammica]
MSRPDTDGDTLPPILPPNHPLGHPPKHRLVRSASSIQRSWGVFPWEVVELHCQPKSWSYNLLDKLVELSRIASLPWAQHQFRHIIPDPAPLAVRHVDAALELAYAETGQQPRRRRGPGAGPVTLPESKGHGKSKAATTTSARPRRLLDTGRETRDATLTENNKNYTNSNDENEDESYEYHDYSNGDDEIEDEIEDELEDEIEDESQETHNKTPIAYTNAHLAVDTMTTTTTVSPVAVPEPSPNGADDAARETQEIPLGPASPSGPKGRNKRPREPSPDTSMDIRHRLRTASEEDRLRQFMSVPETCVDLAKCEVNKSEEARLAMQQLYDQAVQDARLIGKERRLLQEHARGLAQEVAEKQQGYKLLVKAEQACYEAQIRLGMDLATTCLESPRLTEARKLVDEAQDRLDKAEAETQEHNVACDEISRKIQEARDQLGNATRDWKMAKRDHRNWDDLLRHVKGGVLEYFGVDLMRTPGDEMTGGGSSG